MSTNQFPLHNTDFQYGQVETDKESGQKVLHVSNPHTLVQAAGYLKHIRAAEQEKGVFFRGQRRLYPTMAPTIFRGPLEPRPRDERRKVLNEFLHELNENGTALTSVPEYSREPLLQHYGINTTWIDVVDNVWVALWFACYEAKVLPRRGSNYLHFEKRTPGPGRYAYVVMLESAFFKGEKNQPGYYRDDRSDTVDLRVAAPSHFIRPHAQHGLAARYLSYRGKPWADGEKMHVGTIRVDLDDALNWMGSASTLTVHSLFPPAFYDYGYRELLEALGPCHEWLGGIFRVQA